MSMLTPPGMGGKYRVRGDRYPQMRKPRGRRRVVLVSAAVITALGLLGWGSLQLVDVFTGGSTEARASGKSTAEGCASPAAAQGSTASGDEATEDGAGGDKAGGEGAVKPGDGEKTAYPEPKKITVNVLNATKKSGLAKSTSDELKKRGFKPGEVGNAPKELDKKVKGTAVLLGAPGADTTAGFKVLGTQVKGAEHKYDERKGNDIDLVIGDAFKKLEKKKDAEQALDALNNPKPAPSATRCEK